MRPGDVVDPRLRHFLVARDDSGLRRVDVFDDQAAALVAYDQAEQDGIECVLLGADSLQTCMRTHGSWFDLAGSTDELVRMFLSASDVTTLPCECENPARGFYEGRDGRQHCEQCDGLAPVAALPTDQGTEVGPQT